MQPSNNGTDPAAAERFRAGVPAVVEAMLAGGHGFTVRCTPHRRTIMGRTADGSVVYGKLRDRRPGDAKAEWHWLHVLPMLGLAVPQPVAIERRGAATLLCTAAAAGRPVDALLAEHLPQRRGAALRFCCDVVAPAVRTLHQQGLVFRDLYWNHLFAPSLEPGVEVVFVDVERVFRPRWRRGRWRVKDLAGLLASFPGPVQAREGLLFLCAYLGEDAGNRRHRRRLFRAVQRKAQRIQSHVPKYG